MAKRKAAAQQPQGPPRRSERVKAKKMEALMSKVSKTPIRKKKARPKALPSASESSGDERYRPPPPPPPSPPPQVSSEELLAPIPPAQPTPPRQIIPGWQHSPDRGAPGPPSPGPVEGPSYFTNTPSVTLPQPIRVGIITDTGDARITTSLDPTLASAFCRLIRHDLYAAHKLPPAQRKDINISCKELPPSAAAHFAYVLHHGHLAKLDDKGVATELPLSLTELARVYRLAWQMRSARIQNLVMREYVKQVTEGNGVLNKETAAEVYHRSYFKVMESRSPDERSYLQRLVVQDRVVSLQLEREFELGKEYKGHDWEGWPEKFRWDMMALIVQRARMRSEGRKKDLEWDLKAEQFLLKEEF